MAAHGPGRAYAVYEGSEFETGAYSDEIGKYTLVPPVTTAGQ